MSISTYSELKTAVANHLERSDLTSRIPEFITIGEDIIANGLELNGKTFAQGLRCRYNEKRVTASISTEYFDKPSDFLEMRNIQLNTSPIRRLRVKTPEQMDTIYPSTATGKPVVYAIHGTEFQLKPVPDSTYTIQLTYYYRLTAFSGDTDTNNVLTKHPGIYLYSALLAAEPYIKNDERIMTWSSAYAGIVNSVNNTSKKGQYSGSALVISSDWGNP